MSGLGPHVGHYVDQIASRVSMLPGNDLPWVKQAREQALDTFASVGFPTQRHEDWKYTRVSAIEKRAFAPRLSTPELPPRDCVDRFRIVGSDCHTLVLVDGQYCEPLSTLERIPGGVTVMSFAQAMLRMPDALEAHLGKYAPAQAHGFSALNTAFMGEGAFIHMESGITVDEPIHLLFVSTQSEQDVLSQPRILITAEPNSAATVIEHYVCVGEPDNFTNALTEVSLGRDARLAHYKLQQESSKAFHIATLAVQHQTGSSFESHLVSLGGRLVRSDINVCLDGEGAHCELNGLYMSAGRQHMDFHTRVDHAKPLGTSREYYKGVLTGHSRAVFNGKVYVHPDAQGTDARQSNDNLLLSRDAEVDTKPQLEIYADDVKCAHGATVGQLDENMVFYLRSRGIGEKAARGLLTYGFAREVIERMSLTAIKTKLEDQLLSWLPDAEEVREIVA